MKEMASYYRCALQVNSYSYARYRGDEPEDEISYNNEIVEKCKCNSISVVGLADHGSVDSSVSLRKALQDSGITVFPGFEISTAEKIHIVCLFPPSYDSSVLNRILGSLGLTSVEKGTEVSQRTCKEISSIIQENSGFWYAAHITGDNGILKLGKNQHIWTDRGLVAAQIPSSRDEIDPAFKNIINNTDRAYHREHAVALINAADIEKPEDLDKMTASVLVKMTSPNFENFCAAFKDPESRIRLNSEREKNYQSCIKHLRVEGGYLDGLDVDLSENLSTIIGGRGTGKSTLIGLIRYALNKEPYDSGAKKEFYQMIDTNLKMGGRIELTVISNEQHGQEYIIKRRYNQNPTVVNKDGSLSPLRVSEILPTIEIYGQNEILEVAKDTLKIRDVADRLFSSNKEVQDAMDKARKALYENSKALDSAEKENDKNNSLLEELPSIQAKIDYYNKAGIDKKLELVTTFAKQEGCFNALKKSLTHDEESYKEITVDNLTIESCAELEAVYKAIINYNDLIRELNEKRSNAYRLLINEFSDNFDIWNKKYEKYDREIRKSFKNIENIQDKSGKEIASEYAELIKKREECQPLVKSVSECKLQISDLRNKRKSLIEKYKITCDKYDEGLRKQLKKINRKKLDGTVRLDIRPRQNKKPVLEQLKKIHGIGEKSLLGIVEYEGFDVFTFSDDVRQGPEQLEHKYGISKGIAEKISEKMSEADLRKIEGLQLKDIVDVSLLVGNKYKEINKLSKGQQCTAILNLLLIDNKDPLIIDQPEDNLDNSFIAENLVTILRRNKIKRQYLFATHNANIPVFGDAEQIITMEECDGQGQIVENGIGSIDDPNVKSNVIRILEGGEIAFRMRENKYGI
jgi:ABC-type lipoprotein export system ATPase subunit